MSADFTRWVQARLIAHGLTVDADGLFGSETRTALETFQRLKGLTTTGTATVKTVTALRIDPETGRDAGPAKAEMVPLWLGELQRRKGLHEVRDHSLLSRWLGSDGRTLGDPRKLPWCGDAIQTAIALTLPHEPQLANPYLARNWLNFGKRTEPRTGAVMVFWRGSRKGTSGHVALYLGEDKDAFHVLGANQSNAITETRIARDRLLGARWPLTDSTQTFAVNRAANDKLSTNEA